MSPYDLTNLAALKAWLGLPAAPAPSDARSPRSSPRRAARSCRAVAARPAPQDYARAARRRKPHADAAPLASAAGAHRQWNGVAVPEIAAGGTTPRSVIAPRPGELAPPGSPQALDLFGVTPSHRRANVVVDYQAGYAVHRRDADHPRRRAIRLAPHAPYGTVGERSWRRLCAERGIADGGRRPRRRRGNTPSATASTVLRRRTRGLPSR